MFLDVPIFEHNIIVMFLNFGTPKEIVVHLEQIEN